MAEEQKKLRVYCETSFWSFLNGRLTPLAHIALKQAATLRWWQEIAPKCEIYISQFVDEEAECGDRELSARRVKCLDSAIALDGKTPEVRELANVLAYNLPVMSMNIRTQRARGALLERHAVPEKEGTDVSHIATASVYGMDVLLTWNCRHMANPVTLPKTASIISSEGFQCPVIITPAEFLERKEEFL